MLQLNKPICSACMNPIKKGRANIQGSQRCNATMLMYHKRETNE